MWNSSYFQLCEIIPPDVVQQEELLQFFSTTMGPLVRQVHSSSAATLSIFVNDLIGVLQSLMPHEVKLFIDVYILRNNSLFFRYYEWSFLCTNTRMYQVLLYTCLWFGSTVLCHLQRRKRLRRLWKMLEEWWTALHFFLSNTSTSLIVSKATGAIRRSVMFVPHTELVPDDLERLKVGAYYISHTHA